MDFTHTRRDRSFSKWIANRDECSRLLKPLRKKPLDKSAIEHVCTVCQFSTHCSLELNDHLKSHLNDSESSQKCTFCAMQLPSIDALYNHVAQEHFSQKETLSKTLTSFRCTICRLQSPEYSALSGHICEELIGIEPSEPIPASAVYPNPENRDGTQYACDICPYITFNQASFQRHRNKHRTGPAIKCVYCGRPMISKNSYESHVARQHVEALLATIRKNMEGVKVKCMFCDLLCGPKGLNKHIDAEHKNAKNCLLNRSKAQKV